MQELLDLIDIVRNDKIPPLKIYRLGEEAHSKTQELFNGFMSREFLSDEDAARKLYDCQPSDKRYMMLRSYLVDNLVQSLNAYDYSSVFSEANHEILSCYRSLFSISVLLYSSKRAAATSLAHKLLRKAEDLHFTDIQIRLLKVLRQTASLAGDLDAFQKYCSKLNDLLILQQWENEAEELCQFIELNYNRQSVNSLVFADYAEAYLERTRTRMESSDSFILILFRYRIELLMNSIRARFDNILSICKEALSWMDRYPKLASKTRRSEFIFAGINAALRLREFQLAHEYAAPCVSSYLPGTRNWFLAASRLVQTLICMKDLSGALKMFKEAVSNPRFEKLDGFQKERWIILGAYMALFLEKDEERIRSIRDKKLLKALTKTDFWSEMKMSIHDKEGLNLTILILQLLFFLEKDDYYDAARGKLRLIQKYMKRSLKEKSYERTELFLDKVAQFMKGRQDTPGLPRSLEILKSGKVLDDVELVPYEQMWELILATAPKQDRYGIRV